MDSIKKCELAGSKGKAATPVYTNLACPNGAKTTTVVAGNPDKGATYEQKAGQATVTGKGFGSESLVGGLQGSGSEILGAIKAYAESLSPAKVQKLVSDANEVVTTSKERVKALDAARDY